MKIKELSLEATSILKNLTNMAAGMMGAAGATEEQIWAISDIASDSKFLARLGHFLYSMHAEYKVSSKEALTAIMLMAKNEREIFERYIKRVKEAKNGGEDPDS